MLSTYPALGVAIVSCVFGFFVIRKYLKHANLSNLFWGSSLLLSTFASLGYAICLWTTPHSGVAFYVYYVCGALWMPAIMGFGSLGLVFSRKVVFWLFAVVAVLGLIGTYFLVTTPLRPLQLTKLAGGAGVGVIPNGLWLAFLITLNSFGALAVFLVALWSGYVTLRKRATYRFFLGNLLLAIGILIISSAGSMARLGAANLFWVTMLVGWCVTFGGYIGLTPLRLYAQRKAVHVKA